jgi:hypothetical protein
MNAAQLEALKKAGTHFTTRLPNCPQELCWCGLCHCEKCQTRRAAEFLAANDTATERGPNDPPRSADV